MTRPPTKPPSGTVKPPPPPAPPARKPSTPTFFERLMDLSAQNPMITPAERRILEIVKELLPGIALQCRIGDGGGSIRDLDKGILSTAVKLAVVAAVELESQFHEIRDNARSEP